MLLMAAWDSSLPATRLNFSSGHWTSCWDGCAAALSGRHTHRTVAAHAHTTWRHGSRTAADAALRARHYAAALGAARGYCATTARLLLPHPARPTPATSTPACLHCHTLPAPPATTPHLPRHFHGRSLCLPCTSLCAGLDILRWSNLPTCFCLLCSLLTSPFRLLSSYTMRFLRHAPSLRTRAPCCHYHYFMRKLFTTATAKRGSCAKTCEARAARHSRYRSTLRFILRTRDIARLRWFSVMLDYIA